MPQAEPIDPGKYSFLTLMNDIENGRVRLPPFQREFVWGLGKVIDLMDSIYKGFPIGSFFYWKADRKYVTLFRDIKSLCLPSPAPEQELFFILDGQQRLTSIWVTFKGSVIQGATMPTSASISILRRNTRKVIPKSSSDKSVQGNRAG